MLAFLKLTQASLSFSARPVKTAPIMAHIIPVTTKTILKTSSTQKEISQDNNTITVIPTSIVISHISSSPESVLGQCFSLTSTNTASLGYTVKTVGDAETVKWTAVLVVADMSGGVMIVVDMTVMLENTVSEKNLVIVFVDPVSVENSVMSEVFVMILRAMEVVVVIIDVRIVVTNNVRYDTAWTGGQVWEVVVVGGNGCVDEETIEYGAVTDTVTVIVSGVQESREEAVQKKHGKCIGDELACKE